MSPEYFMKHLTFYEASAYIEGVNNRMRGSWEQTRMLMAAWCGKDVFDSFRLPWDDENDPQDEDEKSEQDKVEYMRRLMAQRQKEQDNENKR